MEEIYGLNHSIKSFAVSNKFVENTNKACYKLGTTLTPFCIYANEVQNQYGVIDFAKFGGFCGEGKYLEDEIVNYRSDLYRKFGITVDVKDKTKRKLLVFDYLMSISICYVEIPKWKTQNGVRTATYDKFLCTRNPAIMAVWMGDDPNVMQGKYSAKITNSQVDFNNNVLRFVKLATSTGKGNTVSVPRQPSSTLEMRCTPLYMLYAFTEGFKEYLGSNILKFSYLKDNGTVRELCSTTSERILMEYYSDRNFINMMLNGTDINSVQQGGMVLSSHANRGYIKLPEVGSSIYDGTGVRALNVARLLKIERVQSVDKTFINVDLNSVIQNFADGLDYLFKTNAKVMSDVYEALAGQKPESSEPSVIQQELKNYAETRGTLLTTTFYRQLHLFIISHPLWFPLYTGKPNNSSILTSSSNIGATPMDF